MTSSIASTGELGRYRDSCFPGGRVLKNLPASAGVARDPGFIPGSRRSPGGGNGDPLQCSCLENSMDTGSWWTTVPGVTESDTTEQLSTDTNLVNKNSQLK